MTELIPQPRFREGQGLEVSSEQTYLQELTESSNRAQFIEVHQRCGQGP